MPFKYIELSSCVALDTVRECVIKIRLNVLDAVGSSANTSLTYMYSVLKHDHQSDIAFVWSNIVNSLNWVFIRLKSYYYCPSMFSNNYYNKSQQYIETWKIQYYISLHICILIPLKHFKRDIEVDHDKDLIKCVPVHHHQRVTARWISNNTFKLLLNIDIVPKKVELVPLDNIIDTVKYAFEMQWTCYLILI